MTENMSSVKGYYSYSIKQRVKGGCQTHNSAGETFRFLQRRSRPHPCKPVQAWQARSIPT